MTKPNYIQLIPGLVSLVTPEPMLNGLSFWDSSQYRDFFEPDYDSAIKCNYLIRNKKLLLPEAPTLRFSNLSYCNDHWYYSSKKGPLSFEYYLEENSNTLEVSWWYHKIFVRIGWLEPAGNILTDYLTYQLEKIGKTYHSGAAVEMNNRSFLLFGFGKNYKTTLVNYVLDSGGYYIGEEFFVLSEDRVYATIPTLPRFDFRQSHKDISNRDIKQRKVDVSEYKVVIFMLLSDRQEIKEIGFEEANHYAEIYHHQMNSFFYQSIKSRDFLLYGKDEKTVPIIKNKNARFFVIEFTEISEVMFFIKNYGN